MILITKSKEMAIFIIVILFFPYFSLSFSPEYVYSIGTSFSDEIPSSTSNTLKMATQPPQVLRILDFYKIVGNTWNFDSLANYTGGSSPGSYIFDTLVDHDFETGNIIPSLAQSWVVSNDSTQWLFILQEDVWFHDGSKFNASVVKYNFDRLIDPNHPAYVSTPVPEKNGLLLESVDVISDYRVMFTFSTPYAPFINVHASSVELVSPNSFHGENLTIPIGTGPYKYTQPIILANKTILPLTRNVDYFRGLPPFEQVLYTVYNSREDYSDAIIAEEGDIVGSAASIWYNTDYWDLSTTEVGIIRFGWLNQQREEFTNRKVRLAMNYAVNKSEYMTKISGVFGAFWDGVVSQSIIPRHLPYWDESLPGYPYNVTKTSFI